MKAVSERTALILSLLGVMAIGALAGLLLNLFEVSGAVAGLVFVGLAALAGVVPALVLGRRDRGDGGVTPATHP